MLNALQFCVFIFLMSMKSSIRACMKNSFSLFLIFVELWGSMTNQQVVHGVPATCDVSDAGNAVEVFSHEDFSVLQDSEDFLLKTIIPAKVTESGSILLTEIEENGGVAGYAWLLREERVGDGFLASYTFRKEGTSDGFAFVVQKDKVKNMNGKSSQFLGYNNIKRSVAVAIDFCPNRGIGISGENCANPSMAVVVQDAEGKETIRTTSTPDSFVIEDNVVYTVRVLYADYKQAITVSLNGTPILTDAPLGIGLTDLLGSRLATIGFTGSTSWDDTIRQEILSLDLKQLPSNTIVENVNQELVWNNVVTFFLIFRDACKVQLEGAAVTVGIDQVETRLTEVLDTGTDTIITPTSLEPEQIINNNNGSFSLIFKIPEFKAAIWKLEVVVDGESAFGSPYESALISTRPPPILGGFPVEWFVLLLILLLVLLIAVALLVQRVRQYRKKLKSNEEFIKAGEEQDRLDALEVGVTYQKNPMMGSIEDLKKKLKNNQEELARLEGQGAREDDHFTLEQLEKQRNDLLHEMNRLKREEQEQEVDQSTNGAVAKKKIERKRVEFNPQRSE